MTNLWLVIFCCAAFFSLLLVAEVHKGDSWQTRFCGIIKTDIVTQKPANDIQFQAYIFQSYHQNPHSGVLNITMQLKCSSIFFVTKKFHAKMHRLHKSRRFFCVSPLLWSKKRPFFYSFFFTLRQTEVESGECLVYLMYFCAASACKYIRCSF